MPPKKSVDDLKELVAKKKAAILLDLSNNKLKTEADLSNDIVTWVSQVNASLDTNLEAYASTGRSFYIVESPVFFNPGKKYGGGTTHGGKSLYFEAAFRAYLKSLRDPVFTPGAGISVTEIVPIAPRETAPIPDLPQNVVLRYKFSW